MQLAPRMFNQRPFDLQSVVHDHGCPLIGAFTTKLATCTAGGHLWATCALVIEIALLMLLSAWVKRCPNRLLRRAFGSKRGVSPRPPLSRSAPYDCYIYSNYLFRLAKCVRQRCKLRSSGLEPSGVTTAGNF